MFCYFKRNILLDNADCTRRRLFPAGWVGEVPEEFAQGTFFNALVKDGEIVITKHDDKSLQKADEAPVVIRREPKEEPKEEPKKSTRRRKK